MVATVAAVIAVRESTMADIDEEIGDTALALAEFGGPSDGAALRRAIETNELTSRLLAALPSGDRTSLLGFAADAATTPRQRLSLLQLYVSELQAQALLSGVAPTPIRAPAPVPARLRGALGALSASLRAGPVAQGEAPAATLRRLEAAARALQSAAAPPATAASPAPAVAPPPTAGGTPLIAADALGAAQLEALDRVNQALREEYAMRRQMLLKRLDVLADSFSWSERAKEQRGEMEAALAARRAALPPPSAIEPRDAFGATAELLELQRAAALSEGASVKKVRIGKVPDRGGRADETFFRRESFSQQAAGERRGGGGGGGRGRGGGRGKHGGRGKQRDTH